MLEQLGITTVTLDLPFRLNHVNCFMAEGENGWTIIDAGLHNTYTKAVWEEQIRGKNITDLYITHYHPDHFGFAGRLQQMTDARVSMSKTDAHNSLSKWNMDFIQELPVHYEKAGLPLEMAHHIAKDNEKAIRSVTPFPTFDHYFTEGEKVLIGRYEYEVIFTPGHAEGLVCFYNAEKNVLFSTDHILPGISPNISHWFGKEENPLRSFFHSLEKVKQLDVEFVIPSHGRPFYGANERINELIKHHEERLEETLQVITVESTVFETCERLFRRELSVHESRFAIGETLAHLEYLRQDGQCLRELKDGKWYYSAN
ncbi:MBL fold metallo-hydrolase [Sporosarcina sp. HYO08]|uniref:MBL fold metallo-hydrolase n=1 Tax=Sporosarcina sp. HYO08 TaxID=1759557 RepID=UPI000797AAB3|nr:MBL fold metallo-hydrolase [Sporosarcina sp. HYO08]KXH87569.1 hypothetical protein AU377_01655 [Sporosarcina sp. HYO08]